MPGKPSAAQNAPAIVEELRRGLRANADAVKAPEMQAYMKTDQPFWGVQKPIRAELLKNARRNHPIKTEDNLLAAVAELWSGPKREEQYLAIDLAGAHKRLLSPASIPLLERMLHESTNWDLVDGIVCGLVSPLILRFPELMSLPRTWISSENFWIRRASLLCHIKHKERTDRDLLAASIVALAHEKEFFIRKAIGWILREFGKTDPDWVRNFVAAHEDQLSNLSKREALRRL